MISQLTGACVRAILVIFLIATPSLVLPGMGPGVTQIVALIAIFLGGFVFSEYASTYPGLIEFRDAAPYNRMRFGMALILVLFISLVILGQTQPSSITRFAEALGMLLGLAIDFPFSPLRALLGALPPDADPSQVSVVRVIGGLAYLTALISLTVFAILIRFRSWPSPSGTFNFWINLPMIDPTAGGDLVNRLRRDARINILLGIALPYILPSLVWSIGAHYGVSILTSELALIWTVTLWAFLPATVFMRGIALMRLSQMILDKRRRMVASLEPGEYAQSSVRPELT